MDYIILIVSLAALIFGADRLVSGAVIIAKKLKISDFVIGAVIVGIGTSMPEMVVSLIGAVKGNADVAIGNVVGSNIFNVLAILGLTATIFPIAIARVNMKFEIPLCIALSFLLFGLTFNTIGSGQYSLGRADGLILLAIFVIFMYYSIVRDRKAAALKLRESASQTAETAADTEETKPLWNGIVWVVVGLAFLIFGCDFFVDATIRIARSLGVSDAFISITILACGTSLPELAASLASAAKKNTQMALGNIVGSNIFNIAWILGLSSQITTLTVRGITMIDYVVMTGAAILPLLFGFRGRIGRAGGFAMLLCYAGYTAYLISNL